jgi:hypothetical protein
LQKNKQTNKQAKKGKERKDNYGQKTFDCETRYYNNSNNSISNDKNIITIIIIQIRVLT